jgi:hypothetical protein
MFLLRHGLLPSSIPSKAARVCVFGPLLLVAGCASEQKASYVNGPHFLGPGQQMAAAPRKVEIEDDGQPVQPPPARPINPAEDDPTQPWSPNYGKGIVGPSSPRPTHAPRLPRQMDASIPAPIPTSVQTPFSTPVSYRRPDETSTGSFTVLSAAEADEVVARALSAHEMRKR